jgi:RNA polymerase sigma-70 factor (ECF subfamily)
MKRYCDGDLEAFEELYAAVAPRLLGFLRMLLRDEVTAEEVLQQTFLKLHNARSRYEPGADPLAWLYAIAHRTCIDELRRRRRARVLLVRDPEDGQPEAEASFAGDAVSAQSDSAYSDAQQAAVLGALRELPDNQRAAVSLTKIQGLTMSAAATALGTTEAAVKLRAHRAYARLREILGRDEIFHERLDGAAARSRRFRERRRCVAEA